MSLLPDASARLFSLLRELSPLALAFSGGLDSRFLAHMACRSASSSGVRLRLFHFTGPHMPEAETAFALAQAEAMGLELSIVPVDPLANPEVAANGPERCYHCKRHLFTLLHKAAARHPAFAGQRPTLCDGTNASDLREYRPGLRALHELGVRSPLAETGFDKALIRNTGAATGLACPEQKARPCLLTRYAYGLSPTHSSLRALAQAERTVQALLDRYADTAREAGASVPAGGDFRIRLLPAGKERQRKDTPGPHGAPTGTPSLSVPELSVFVPELHLTEELPPDLLEKLRDCVAATGFFRPNVVMLSSVHGYFDQNAL